MEINVGDLFMNDDRDSTRRVTEVLPQAEDGLGEPRAGLGGGKSVHLGWWLGQGWSPCTQEEWDQACRDLTLREQLHRDWKS